MGTPCLWNISCILGHPVYEIYHVYWETLYMKYIICILGHPVYEIYRMYIGTPCTWNISYVYWDTLYMKYIMYIGTPCIWNISYVYWDTLYMKYIIYILGHPVTAPKRSIHKLPYIYIHTSIYPASDGWSVCTLNPNVQG